jgi:hypothetical protein
MTTPIHPFPPTRNLKWSEMRTNSGHFASISDCASRCLPSLRACASLFYGSRAGGDELIEGFLADVIYSAEAGHGMETPAGLSRAFEQYLRDRFGDTPQRITLASSPSTPRGVWMSVDEFLDALGQL